MTALALDTLATTLDFTAIKSRQNAAWGSGDYARIGSTLQLVGEELAENMNLAVGARVLDVAAGNGNATLAFARRSCDVTSTDFVAALLARGEDRARAEGLPVAFQIADAEDLPFEDGAFDAVASTFGVMFTPNQQRAADELKRVCRSGGKIGLANWTPASFIGALFRLIGQYVAPPAGVKSPALWGTREWLGAAFGPSAVRMDVRSKCFLFRYRSPAHFVDVFRNYYGPTHKAFLALEPADQKALEADFLALIAAHNRAHDGTMVVPSEYLEAIITQR